MMPLLLRGDLPCWTIVGRTRQGKINLVGDYKFPKDGGNSEGKGEKEKRIIRKGMRSPLKVP